MGDSRNLGVKIGANTETFVQGISTAKQALNAYNKALQDNKAQTKEVNSEIKSLEKEQAELKAEIAKSGEATDGQKQRMQELADKLSAARQKAAELATQQSELKSQIRATTSDLNENVQGLHDLSSELHNTSSNIEEVSDNVEETTDNVQDASESVENADEKFSAWKVTLGNLASQAIQSLIHSLSNLAKSVIATGEAFTASMSEVQGISGATAEELKTLEQTAREYGQSTIFSATESAEALKYMALAGWNTEQSISALGSVLNLAAASNMDLATASDIVTDYITAFGLSAEKSAKFVDEMAYAMSHSNTTTQQLGEAYKNCAATANSMGYSVEDVTAVIMTMANAGVKGGEAGTALNTLMTRLATNTKDCADALKEYGVDIYDAEGNMNDLANILEGVAEAWQGLTDEQQANLAKQIIGTNQYSSFQTIMAGLSEQAKSTAQSFSDYSTALETCDGTAMKMAETMSTNLSGDIKILNSALDELKLKIFDDAEGPLRNLVQTITTQGVPALEAIIENLDKILPVVVGATTAFIGFKAAVGIQSVIDTVKASFAGLTAATVAETAATHAATVAHEGLNTAMKANPIVLVISLVASLAAGLITLCAASDAATESVDNYIATIEQTQKSTASTVANAESNTFVIQELNEEYERLRKQTKLNSYEQKQLDSIASQLASKLGITTDEIKNQSGAYKELSAEIEQVTLKMKNQAELNAAQSLLESAYEAKYQLHTELLNKNEEMMNLYERYNTEGTDDYHNSDIYNQFLAASDAIDELSKQYEEACGYVEEYEQNLGDLIKKQNESTKAVEDVKDELKDLEAVSLTATEAAEKQEEAEKAVVDALGDVIKSQNLLKTAQEAVEEGNTISLNTLNSIQKEYPKLIDLVNDYINGVKTEADVIEALEAVYKDDVNSYNNALVEKQRISNQWYEDSILNNDEWVNKFLEDYNIDLKNYAEYEKNKLAIQKELFKQQQNINAITLGMQNGTLYELPYDELSAREKELVDNYNAEINRLNKAMAAIDSMASVGGSSSSIANLANNLTSLGGSSESSSGTSADDEYQKQLDLAYEAYNKLINDRIELIEAESDAAKKAADEKIAAINKEIEARKRLNEDTDRQAEIDAINAQLEYAQLDELSRRELERKKQDLLDEQAEVDWERQMQDEKEAIQNGLSITQEKNDEAMEALKAASESAKNYFDKLAGTQTNSQIVNNNSDTRNIQIIQNALNDPQMVDKLLAAIYDK